MIKRHVQVAFALLGIGCGGVEGGAGSEADTLGIPQELRPTQPLSAATWTFIPITGMTCANGRLFLGASLFGPSSLSDGLFQLRQLIQRTSPNVSFFFVPSLLHDYIHQDPATWPNPSPPYGNINLSLSSWMTLEVQ
jgi:hypothetical protein